MEKEPQIYVVSFVKVAEYGLFVLTALLDDSYFKFEYQITK